MSLVKGKAHEEWMKDLEIYNKTVSRMTEGTDIKSIRSLFYPLSDQLYYSIKKFNVKTGAYRQFCPMAFDFKGGFWLSDSEEIRNPYFGDEMLSCGNVEEELK